MLQARAVQAQPVAQNLWRIHHRTATHLLAQVTQQQFACHIQAMG